MFRKLSAAFLIAAMLVVIGCSAHVHTVGKGPQGYDVTEARQWYIVWGLVPINEVDTNAMAAGATDYEITTLYSPIDFIIGVVAGSLTISSRTVSVRK